MPDVKLTVFAHLSEGWAPCGQLLLAEEGTRLLASSFAYGLNYLKRPNALEVDPVSLSIGDRDAIRAKRLFPVNGLPFFGGIRDAAPDAWGRRVIEAKLRVPANSLPESRYLIEAGSERVGALDVRKGLDTPPSPGVAGLHALDHLMAAAERIERGAPVPAHLDVIFMDGTALGGARPKASIRDESGVLWLSKFASHNDPFDIPAVEYATLRLAGLAGIAVPPVRLLSVGKRKTMLARRFDRYWTQANTLPARDADIYAPGPGQDRIEMRMGFTSGLTLLACDETESRDKSYTDLAHGIRRYCHVQAVQQNVEELFKRMVYNILVTNDDDHLRNHGFVWDPRLPGWRLSPLYDVLPRASMASERYLHLGIGHQGRLATLDNALSAHEAFTPSRARACELVDEVWRAVRQWRMHFEGFGVEPATIDKVSPAFRHLDDVTSPKLRRLLP